MPPILMLLCFTIHTLVTDKNERDGGLTNENKLNLTWRKQMEMFSKTFPITGPGKKKCLKIADFKNDACCFHRK